MADDSTLPPGQYELASFPRFGLSRFADRLPDVAQQIRLTVAGDVEAQAVVSEELRDLPRVEQVSDFHCVTTWSTRSLCWGGYLFSDFFNGIVAPQARPQRAAQLVVLRCCDGYAVSLPLADLMAGSVLLADRLNGEPLSVEHGAPLRLVAPAHYGYKNAKHLRSVEFWTDARRYRSAAFRFMDHPRARVALEERGRGVPGRLLRYLYRPLVAPTIRRFKRALDRHRKLHDDGIQEILGKKD
ncbi:MAG: molybdopterin-dependent oxidoreductase [Candidatus Parcubacteria bacterium]|nr:molybdopterin-dependent oxidoreductase [Burkholderiales bacterium]